MQKALGVLRNSRKRGVNNLYRCEYACNEHKVQASS